MINERGIAFRYLKAQKKRSVLLVFGVMLAIALVCTVFSMLNVLQAYEVTQTSEGGIWHVMAQGVTKQQAQDLARRVDVSASGESVSVQSGVTFEGKATGALTGCDVGGAKQLNLKLKAGAMPQHDNEIALEQWALAKIKPEAAVGGTFAVQFDDGTTESFVLSGIFQDNIQHKESGGINAAVTLGKAEQLAKTDKVSVLMQVRKGIDVDQFVSNIARDQHIDKGSISQHTSLLAALGRSKNANALNIYFVGGFLALLVLFAAIMMIYNAFNISVTQRVRQFGILRAMGATPKQIRKVVKSEALLVSLFGVVPGLIVGFLATNVLLIFLRHVMPEYFTPDGPAFYISWISLVIGALAGILATVISSLMPARKAGRVSPVEAIATVGGKSIQKKTASGIAVRIIPVEAALSFRRLILSKRAFIFTALSLSFGILLMLCFSPVMDMLRAGTEHNFDFGDMYVAQGSQDAGFSDNLIQALSKIDGIKSVQPNRIASADATFKYALLGNEYQSGVKSGGWQSVKAGKDGMVEAPSKSALVGMTDQNLLALRSKLVFGNIDPKELDLENGVILVLSYNGSVDVGDLRPGDSIYIGAKKLKICGVIKRDMIMYAYTTTKSNGTFIGMYTTNKVLDSVADIQPNLITMTLKNGADSDTVYNRVKDLTKGIPNVQTADQYQSQNIARRILLVSNVFIYGFIAIIALIGILNIINTMSTNILVRTREIGLLRAGGMTMGQVTAMVASEAALYGLLALVISLAVGIPLEHLFFNMIIKQFYSIPWSMPWDLVIVSSAITLAAVMLSIFSPLRAIKKIVITQAVTVE